MKKLLVSLVVVLLLVMGVFFGLPFLLSSDAARQEVAKSISAVSGMKITLGGPVDFSFFPDMGLVAKDVKLASLDGKMSVSISEIVSSVKLSSMLSGKIEVIGLTVRKPEITIVASDQKPEAAKTTQIDEKRITDSDPFAAAIDQLERLSVKKLSISNGTFISQSSNGARSIVTNINAELRAPSLEGQIDLVLNATRDGQKISMTAAISALRSILQRQPSNFKLALKMNPAPHPILADLAANGNILLSEDGSYQIIDGLFSSLNQPLRMDAKYVPGERPYVSLSLDAKQIDLGVIQKNTASKIKSTKRTQPDAAPLDLSSLVDFDADISVNIDSFRMDSIEVREFNLDAALKNGALNINLGNTKIADGSITAKISSDVNVSRPEIRGRVTAAALKISDFAQLANLDLPLTGNLGLDFNFGFRGLSNKMVMDSLNLAGGIKVTNGTVIIPALAENSQIPNKISNLNVEAKISDVQKPINIIGKMVWNGEAISFGSRVTPTEFIAKNSGPLKLSIRSSKINADYSGKINLSGAVVGQLKLATKSLGSLMTWVGQNGQSHLGAFSYNGKISADATSFSFDKASFALDNIKASGSGSIDMYGRPSIVTDLSFDELDIVALLGSETKIASKKNTKNTVKSGSVPIDLSVLKSFDAHMKLKAKKVLYGKVVAGPINSTLIVKDGKARIALPKTPFYGGIVLADILADGSGDIPSINIDAKLSDINALPLFSDAANFKRIEGKLNSSIKIAGVGKTNKQFANSLKGSSSARFSDGAIRGINIAKIYNNLTAVLAGGFTENQDEKTKFTELGLSFQIDNGIAVTNDIKLLSPLVRMDGAGNVDLAEETIDMRLNPRVVLSTTGQSGDFNLDGVEIPVLIKGSLNNPRVYPDLKGILKNPKAALDLVSKLGQNIGGLANITKEPIKNVIGNLISNTVQKQGDTKIGGTENLVNSLINQALKSKIPKLEENNQIQNTRDNSSQISNVGINVTGQVPVPILSPRRQVSVETKPDTTTKQIVDQVVPKLNLPIEDSSVKSNLENLINNQLQ